jgi:hypothetical protein
MKTKALDCATYEALTVLQVAMGRISDASLAPAAYAWLTDAANHLRGYKIQRPQLRASTLYPEAK